MTQYITYAKKTLSSYLIARRNRQRRFEFGDVQPRDRIMMSAWLSNGTARQGKLLNENSVFDTSLILPSGKGPSLANARDVFRLIQRMFESSAVEAGLRPWKILGFMSDSTLPNGMAGCLHREDESVFYINVTAGAYFHTLFSAYTVTADRNFVAQLPADAGFLTARAPALYEQELRIPLNSERRELAIRIASKALHAVFFHELAHILRGHILFVKHQLHQSDSSISEGSDSQPIIDPLQRALELDADDYSGRFLAKYMFTDVSKDGLTLKNPLFLRRAYELLTGIVLMYSWFPESAGYHGGTLRAYTVLTSMFAELGLYNRETTRWFVNEVAHLENIMSENSMRPSYAEVNDEDAQALLSSTMQLREERQKEWLSYRPWKSN